MSECKFNPTIILPSLGSVPVYKKQSDGKPGEQVWPPAVKTESLLGSLKAPLAATMLFKKDAGLSEAVARILNKMSEPLTVKKDSSFQYPLLPLTFRKPFSEYSDNEKQFVCKKTPAEALAKALGEENVYYFGYNFLENPLITAEELQSFIQQIMQKSGADKVNILCLGLACTWFFSYLKNTENASVINRCVFVAPAFNGSPVFTDLLNRNIAVDGILRGISKAGVGATQGMGSLVGALPKGVVEKIVQKSLNSVLETVIKYNPAMVPAVSTEDYQALLGDVFYFDTKHIELADALQETNENLPDILQNHKNGGACFFNIVGYGGQLLPLSPDYTQSSDGIVPLSSSVLGVLDVKPNEAPVFPENAVFADSVWGIQHINHMKMFMHPTTVELVNRIFSDAEFTGINSAPEFGQLM